MADTSISARASIRAWRVPNELIGVATIIILGAIGFYAFPTELAFLTRLISISLLVLSLCLVTGYSGVATLGHAALFGVAAYAVGNACIAGLTEPLALLVVGAVAGGMMGLISGALIARFRGLPQLVLSIAIGQLVATLANKFDNFTGGSDGLGGIYPSPVLGIFQFDIFSRTGYLLALAVLAVVMGVLLRLVQSPFGLMCRAIKDDSLRTRMIGVSAYPRLVAMYGVSGIVAGLGGALLAMTTGVVGLDSVSFERSADVLVMLVLGGAGNLWSALAGAVLFQFFEHMVAAANPYHWMSLVGLLLILVVIFARRGLGIEVAARWNTLRDLVRR
jgi:branched-chain amino acid transport system permease protein